MVDLSCVDNVVCLCLGIIPRDALIYLVKPKGSETLSEVGDGLGRWSGLACAVSGQRGRM